MWALSGAVAAAAAAAQPEAATQMLHLPATPTFWVGFWVAATATATAAVAETAAEAEAAASLMQIRSAARRRAVA